MPQARFFCRTGGLAGSDHRIGTEATIGRDAENAIVLPAGAVSKRHARIVFDEVAGAYTLEDLRSRNGTRLDGRPVESLVRLGALHVITFGERHDFFFVAPPERAPASATGRRSNDEASPPLAGPRRPERAKTARSADAPAGGRADPTETRIGAPDVLQAPKFEEAAAGGAGADAAGAASSDPPTALDAPPVVAAPPLPERSTPGGPGAEPGAPATVARPPSLLSAPPMTETPVPPASRAPGVAVVLALPGGERRRIDLADGRHVVGRGSDCAIRVDDRMLSREHAAFVVRGDAVTIEDLNSMNGTTFDERPVSHPVLVPLGRTVTFGGRIEAVVTSDDQA